MSHKGFHMRRRLRWFHGKHLIYSENKNHLIYIINVFQWQSCHHISPRPLRSNIQLGIYIGNCGRFKPLRQAGRQAGREREPCSQRATRFANQISKTCNVTMTIYSSRIHIYANCSASSTVRSFFSFALPSPVARRTPHPLQSQALRRTTVQPFAMDFTMKTSMPVAKTANDVKDDA